MPRFLFIVTPKAVGILIFLHSYHCPRCDISHGAVGILVRWLVFYSMAQAWSNTYEPVLSLYVVFAGAYIMHEPPGLLAKQLVAAPADV